MRNGPDEEASTMAVTPLPIERPAKDEYYMHMAATAGMRADCNGRRVGAVLVLGDRVVATGYNGVPSGMLNCTNGGCERCKPEKRTASSGYDLCICVHAEANALMTAARFGIGIEGCTLYSTHQYRKLLALAERDPRSPLVHAAHEVERVQGLGARVRVPGAFDGCRYGAEAADTATKP